MDIFGQMDTFGQMDIVAKMLKIMMNNLIITWSQTGFSVLFVSKSIDKSKFMDAKGISGCQRPFHIGSIVKFWIDQ